MKYKVGDIVYVNLSSYHKLGLGEIIGLYKDEVYIRFKGYNYTIPDDYHGVDITTVKLATKLHKALN